MPKSKNDLLLKALDLISIAPNAVGMAARIASIVIGNPDATEAELDAKLEQEKADLAAGLAEFKRDL